MLASSGVNSLPGWSFAGLIVYIFDNSFLHLVHVGFAWSFLRGIFSKQFVYMWLLLFLRYIEYSPWLLWWCRFSLNDGPGGLWPLHCNWHSVTLIGVFEDQSEITNRIWISHVISTIIFLFSKREDIVHTWSVSAWVHHLHLARYLQLFKVERIPRTFNWFEWGCFTFLIES